MKDNILYERYQRQMLLKEIGESGQEKLLTSKVLVIGAGGLGCPVLQYLTASGVGTIGIVDDDVVSLTNLHRQVLYTTYDVGLLKAERAKYSLNLLNPDIHIDAYASRLTNQNAIDLIKRYDLVVDGTDNFSSRYMINDACVLLKKPLVYGAVSKFEGQVAIFNYPANPGERSANYRDLFPNPPAQNEVLNCADAGVLGVLPGIIGSIQASEVIKYITGSGKLLAGSLLTYNALTNQLYQVNLPVSDKAFSIIPANEEEFKKINYELVCSNQILEIDAAKFDNLIHDKNTLVIDVRSEGELPLIAEFPHTNIPLPQLLQTLPTSSADTIITFCQSGKRSMQAATYLFNTFGREKSVFCLKDGIMSWINYQKNKHYV